MRVAVIGGGPSGLTTLKYLLTAHEFFSIEPIEARLFEAESLIGGTFRYRTYSDAEMVSSRQLTTFSDYKLPLNTPDFLTTDDYCRYLDSYCEKFNLFPHIRLNTFVVSVRRQHHGTGHIINTLHMGEVSQWCCDAVAICSGLHVIPNVPDIPGLSNVPIVFHSSRFKGVQQLGIGKNVLILGSGETGMDIAYRAVKADTHSVTLSHRDGFMCASKRAPEPSFFGMKPMSSKQGNVPYDVGAASLFDTIYLHPLLRDSILPWIYYDCFAKYTNWLVSGTKAGLDQWIGEISPERFHVSKIFFNKSNDAMPYISKQYRTWSIIDRIRSCIAQVPIVDTQDRKIDLAPWPKEVDENGIVTFVKNGRPESQIMCDKVCKPDIVIMATGYSQNFAFLDDSYPRPQDANIRGIWKEGHESVSFIGFIRPSFGAIPPLAELQAQLWLSMLFHQLPSPLRPTTHYCLRVSPQSRIKYGVDHESYAYQLAVDMGAAPNLSQVMMLGWKLTLCWALGANVNAKFRLVGPWKWSGAKEVMESEIWDTIKRRRGFFGHLTLSVMPIMLFGSLSALLYLLSAISRAIELFGKLTRLRYP